MALNTTSVGVGRRNRSFLCMCSRKCIFDIIVILALLYIYTFLYYYHISIGRVRMVFICVDIIQD